MKPKRLSPEPKTLGEHIRKCRLERGLKQTEAAALMRTTEHPVIDWEKGRREPPARFLPAITKFLGYDPFPAPRTVAERLVAKRRQLGYSRKRAAKEWGIVESTLRKWERGEPIYLSCHRAMVAELLGISEDEH